MSPILVEDVGKKYTLFSHPAKRLAHSLTGGKFGRGKEFWALKDVSFEVKSGSTLGIIGANGSGKSTLLQLIAGTLKPTVGRTKVKGRVAALLELGAGFNPEFTGRENVQLSCALHGLTPDQVAKRLPSIEKFAEIGFFLEQPVKQYSSGMFVRLAFAVIAHVDAEILIVDEALAVGDAYFQQKCMRFLHDFMERGTVLFVSHDMASVKSLCTDVIWLQQGQIVEMGSPKTVGDAYLRSQYARTQRVDATPVPPTAETKTPPQELVAPIPVVADTRREVIQQEGLQNRIQIFHFSTRDPGFGAGQAQITSVEMLDAQERALVSIEGGEMVCLRIRAKALATIENPIFGFFLRNRLGLNVFGDNTYLVYHRCSRVCKADSVLEARFGFVMPFLPRGDYSVCVALATGSNENHVQQHWINEALMLKSMANDVHADVLGIPMHEISIEVAGE
ncbi:MAG: ABC transporter ATP-binding protein [Ramlibacter sp.]|nr:ABC transporter ATP-binding protein [Ramlibacter sp.]